MQLELDTAVLRREAWERPVVLHVRQMDVLAARSNAQHWVKRQRVFCEEIFVKLGPDQQIKVAQVRGGRIQSQTQLFDFDWQNPCEARGFFQSFDVRREGDDIAGKVRGAITANRQAARVSAAIGAAGESQ